MEDYTQEPVILESSEGRVHLVLRAFWQGKDLAILLHGGQPHIGAITLAADRKIEVYERPGHHDGGIARKMATTLANSLKCAVAVACGIHYDRITKEEISFIVRQTDIFARALLCALKRREK